MKNIWPCHRNQQYDIPAFGTQSISAQQSPPQYYSPLAGVSVYIDPNNYITENNENNNEGHAYLGFQPYKSMLSDENNIDQVFPNPATDILTIKFNDITEQVSIIDIDGNLIYNGFRRNDELQLDVSDWDPGIYFVVFRGAEYSQTEKLIITE